MLEVGGRNKCAYTLQKAYTEKNLALADCLLKVIIFLAELIMWIGLFI